MSQINTPVSVGYTNDGLVFMHVPVMGPNGEPGKFTLVWEPKQALQIAEWLTTSAKQGDNPLIVTPRGFG